LCQSSTLLTLALVLLPKSALGPAAKIVMVYYWLTLFSFFYSIPVALVSLNLRCGILSKHWRIMQHGMPYKNFQTYIVLQKHVDIDGWIVVVMYEV
jgi:hypothetical protein